MKTVSLEQICRWAGACVPDGAESVAITGVCRNTAHLTAGNLFVPLKGARFDGHDFIGDAAKRGAAAALCARDDVAAQIPLIRVADPLAAAQAIAAGYRSMFPVKVAGVTGSVGKTTTSRMLYEILSQNHRVLTTAEDMNGQQGMAFAAFSLDDSHEMAVFEMGMSHYGELRRLTKIGQPDVALINTIGTAHIEFFGTRENILRAKCEILEGLRPGGTVVLNGDEPLLEDLRGTTGYREVFCGLENPKADLCGRILEEGIGYTRFSFDWQGQTYESCIHTAGVHNVRNALVAAAAAICMGVSPQEAAQGLEQFAPVSGRQTMLQLHGVTVFDDCYNASPESVCASLEVLRSAAPEGQRIAVLGGMLELGDYAREGHLRCGTAVPGCADVLLLFGEGSEAYREGAIAAGMDPANIRVFAQREAMADAAAALAVPGSAFLFKGSHGMKIYEVKNRFLEVMGNDE